jgi:octanoyl-[GcvH]:protein N-octanoyltransferase
VSDGVRVPYRWVVWDGQASFEQARLAPVVAEALAETAAAGRPAIVVRRSLPYLLFGPQDRRWPRFGDAIRWSYNRGYPAFMRLGGGSVVLVDEGTIAFAAARPCRDLTAMHANYRELAGPVVDLLTSWRIPARFGAAPGSYCEGPWDIVVEGRKLVGVAQAIRGGYALVSGLILVRQDPVRTTQLLEAVYAQGGFPRPLNAQAVTNLEALLGHPVSDAAVIDGLYRAYAQVFDLTPSGVTAEEQARAAALLRLRQIPSP